MQLCPFQSHPLEAANFSHESRKRFPSKLSVSRYGALKYFCKEAKWLHSDTSGFFYVLSWNWTKFKKRNAHVIKPTLTARTILDNLEKKKNPNKPGLMAVLLWMSSGLPLFSSYSGNQSRQRENAHVCACVSVCLCECVCLCV